MYNDDFKKTVQITLKQARFLDHLLFKEREAKRKRGIQFIDTDMDYFVSELKDSIVSQTGIEYSFDESEYIRKIQSE